MLPASYNVKITNSVSTKPLKEINDNYSEYRWAWTYRMICDYYNIEELTPQAAEQVKVDYITARRAWIAEIRKDAEKEFDQGDIEKEVYESFLEKLDREVDFENQKLYM